MDPFTLIAGATALYNGIKGAVDSGHEMLDVAEKVGNLFARVAQITQLTSGKRKKRLFQSQGEYEAEAIKLYTLKQKAQKLQLDTRNLFVGAYGQQAWISIQKEVTEMRKEAQRQAAAAQQEAEENMKDLIIGAWLVGVIVLFSVCVGIGMVVFTHK
jgi:hypothetical protein